MCSFQIEVFYSSEEILSFVAVQCRKVHCQGFNTARSLQRAAIISAPASAVAVISANPQSDSCKGQLKEDGVCLTTTTKKRWLIEGEASRSEARTYLP